MGDIVNLRRARRAAAKQQAAADAVANRIRHGTPPSYLAVAKARMAQAERALDGVRLDADPDPTSD